MSKTVEKITWKIWKPASPDEFPCLLCKRGREATHKVVLNDMYRFVLCEDCANLSESMLKDRLLWGRVK